MSIQLTYERFSELIRSLRSNERGSSEKRKKPRVGMRAQVKITIPPALQPTTVWIRDISQNGVGITTYTAIEPGTEFLMSLYETNETPHLIRCNVVHCRKVATGLYHIGASVLK